MNAPVTSAKTTARQALNDMAVVFLTQKVEFDGTLHHDIRDAVYGVDYGGR